MADPPRGALPPSEILAPGVLDGQVALVTGGGTGIGREIALELARCGASVVVTGRRAAELDETVGRAGHGCSSYPADIREEEQVAALLDEVDSRHGRLDLLVNNAGGQFLAPAETISSKGFRAVIRLNLEATWLTSTAAATRFFIPQRHGRIVNITLSPHQGMPGMAHSGAARAAVENLTRTLGTEWARYGTTVTAIALGTIGTDALSKYPDEVRAAAGSVAPAQRLGRPEEVAWTVAFLASRAGAFFSGCVLTLDGGRDNWPGAWPPPEMADDEGNPLAEQRPPTP